MDSLQKLLTPARKVRPGSGMGAIGAPVPTGPRHAQRKRALVRKYRRQLRNKIKTFFITYFVLILFSVLLL